MTVQLHNTGEEFVFKQLDGETVTVSLFNDATDSLTDADDLGAITTEPSGTAYSRQSATVTLSQARDGDAKLDVDDVTFDVSDSTQSVDSCVIIVNFTSSQAGAGDHLFFTAPLTDASGDPQTTDLGRFNSFTIVGQALTLD
jgi:hypothetical protein